MGIHRRFPRAERFLGVQGDEFQDRIRLVRRSKEGRGRLRSGGVRMRECSLS